MHPNESARPVWIGDLLFDRTNRSIKYLENGHLLLLNELQEWEDLRPRLGTSTALFIAFFTALIFNFVMLCQSLTKKRHSYYSKVNCLIGNLAFTNIFLACGFLLYTFLIDVYYDVDSFDTLIMINEGTIFADIWPVAKQIIHTEMVESLTLSQGLILFMISIDRYCSLFPNYSPFVKSPWLFFVINLLPHVISMLALDPQLLEYLVTLPRANMIRLVFVLTPTLIALVFAGCSVARLLQDSYSSNPNHDLSCVVSLISILLIQLVEKFGLFLQLLHANFRVRIVVGSKEGDRLLNESLSTYSTVTKYMLLLSPLYQCVIFLLLMKFYRKKLMSMGERLLKCLICKKKPKLDYSSETMRSIIAEQQRQRRMGRMSFDNIH